MNVIGALFGGVDMVKGAYRIGVNGEHSFDNYVSAGSGVLGAGIAGAIKLGGKAVGGIGRGAERGVIWNNGWRTADGKFASPLGAGPPGGSAEVGVWDAIAAKPGWSVRTGNVAVRDASGQLRYYDGLAISPHRRFIGLEVKSGDASRTAAQRLFDTTLNSNPGNVATGVGQSAGTTVQRSILIMPDQ